jgi:hypothetical protein
MTKIAFKYYLSKNWGKDGGWPGRWFNGECGLFLENNIELTYHDYSLLQSFEREHSGSSFYEEPVHWSTEQSVFNDGIQEITKNLPNLLPKLNARFELVDTIEGLVPLNSIRHKGEFDDLTILNEKQKERYIENCRNSFYSTFHTYLYQWCASFVEYKQGACYYNILQCDHNEIARGMKKIRDEQYATMKDLVLKNVVNIQQDYEMIIFDYQNTKINLKVRMELENMTAIKFGTIPYKILTDIHHRFKDAIFKGYYHNDNLNHLFEKLGNEVSLSRIEKIKKWISDKGGDKYEIGYGYIKVKLKPIDWAYLFLDKKFYLWLQKKGSPPRQLGAEYFYD